jgi:hypothetical protein
MRNARHYNQYMEIFSAYYKFSYIKTTDIQNSFSANIFIKRQTAIDRKRQGYAGKNKQKRMKSPFWAEFLGIFVNKTYKNTENF